MVSKDLPEEDIQQWRSHFDPNSENYILDLEEFYFCMLEIISIGAVINNGGLKSNDLGRIHRGVFKTNKINDDVLSSFNQIRKYRIAIGKPCIPNIKKQLSAKAE